MAEGSQAPAFSKMETSPEVILTKPSKWEYSDCSSHNDIYIHMYTYMYIDMYIHTCIYMHIHKYILLENTMLSPKPRGDGVAINHEDNY